MAFKICITSIHKVSHIFILEKYVCNAWNIDIYTHNKPKFEIDSRHGQQIWSHAQNWELLRLGSLCGEVLEKYWKLQQHYRRRKPAAYNYHCEYEPLITMPLAKFPNYWRTSIQRLLPVTNNSAPADNKPGIDKNRLFELRLPFVTTVL